MLIIGLTGGIGSGKSSVARWFRLKGVPVLDADAIVHELLSDDPAIADQLGTEFGEDVLTRSRKVDRRVLGNKVFSDEAARIRLEEILHPQVRAKMSLASARLLQEGVSLCVWDVPLLLEAGFDSEVDEIWVVWVPYEIQLRRVRLRDQLPEDQILARIKAQMDLDKKREYADIVIDNSRSWTDTLEQLEQEWIRLE